MLVHLFDVPHLDNMKILKALIYIKDDLLPLEVGTTKARVALQNCVNFYLRILLFHQYSSF